MALVGIIFLSTPSFAMLSSTSPDDGSGHPRRGGGRNGAAKAWLDLVRNSSESDGELSFTPPTRPGTHRPPHVVPLVPTHPLELEPAAPHGSLFSSSAGLHPAPYRLDSTPPTTAQLNAAASSILAVNLAKSGQRTASSSRGPLPRPNNRVTASIALQDNSTVNLSFSRSMWNRIKNNKAYTALIVVTAVAVVAIVGRMAYDHYNKKPVTDDSDWRDDSDAFDPAY